MEKDHSIPPGQPIPKLTQEIKDWCFKHKACFRCRQKNATHRSAVCPLFAGVPDRSDFRGISAVGEENEEPGNDE